MSPRTSGFRRKSQIHCFLIHFSKFRREFRTLRNSRNRRNRQKISSEKQGSLDFAFFHESRNSSLPIGNPIGVKESRSQKKQKNIHKGVGRRRRPPPLGAAEGRPTNFSKILDFRSISISWFLLDLPQGGKIMNSSKNAKSTDPHTWRNYFLTISEISGISQSTKFSPEN